VSTALPFSSPSSAMTSAAPAFFVEVTVAV
jgi:hypothetical protein